MPKFHGQDYVLTGAAETALMYCVFPAIGASWAAHAPIVATSNDGIMSFFISRRAMEKGKQKLLAHNSRVFERSFLRWSTYWDNHDAELYRLATKPGKAWRRNWRRLDELTFRLWKSSYHVEWLDSFTDDIDARVCRAMRKKALTAEERAIMLSPAAPTVPQLAMLDAAKIGTTISWKAYKRRYWYILADWNGGSLLLAKSQLPQRYGLSLLAYKKRQAFQKAIEQDMKPDGRNLLHILRTLALWREARKGQLQRANLAYQKLAQVIARERSLPLACVRYLIRSDMHCSREALLQLAARRQEGCVLCTKPQGKNAVIRTGDDAAPYFKAFLGATRVITMVRGSCAYPGSAKGIVRIVLRKEQFASFQKGEILVTTMTRPEFVPLMRRAKAIVTDEGGLTSHAAILSRELHIPCVVGTGDATRVLKTGDKVEVDATKGIVRKIS